jgi:hypothetical protein
MLDTGTNRYLLTEDNNLSSSGDTLSSVVGIYRNLQKLADRYVILGELRGELMDVTEYTSLDLQAIHQFNYNLTENNPYLSFKEYYAVINNCNYFIDRVDAAQNKALMREYAAVKAMRAWTYMQLALNYGEVYYYEKPLLTVDDMEKIKEQPKYDFNTLARNKLIPDLMPCEAIQLAQNFPAYGISSVNFMPVTLLLADLYLWTEQYELAATKYHDYIERKSILATGLIVLSWASVTFDNAFNYYFSPGVDVVSQIALSQNGSIVSDLPHLFLYQSTDASYYALKPSATAMNNWLKQNYLYATEKKDSIAYNLGDFRGTWPSQLSNSEGNFSYRFAASSQSDSLPYVSKYGYTGSNEYLNVGTVYVHLHKSGSIYLRYAEALNHLNKPTMAFAVLKNGLYESAIRNPKIVSPDEVSINFTGPSLSDPDQDSTYTQISIPPYCNFPNNIFGEREGATKHPRTYNIGIHERGCGEISLDTLYYCIPDASILPTRQDTIRYVDEMICNEYALETAFEGNRFHDLMRFAIRWNDNDFLAERVARKHNNDQIRTKLNNRQNWYLPFK